MQILLFWEGRSHFSQLALEADLHPTLGVDRSAGDNTAADHSFMIRHHRYPQMYVHPRVCSPSTGAATCANSDLSSIPDGTALTFKNMNRSRDAIARPTSSLCSTLYQLLSLWYGSLSTTLPATLLWCGSLSTTLLATFPVAWQPLLHPVHHRLSLPIRP